MSTDEKLNAVRRIDQLAQQANSLWHRAETVKLEVARLLGVTRQAAAEGMFGFAREAKEGGDR